MKKQCEIHPLHLYQPLHHITFLLPNTRREGRKEGRKEGKKEGRNGCMNE